MIFKSISLIVILVIAVFASVMIYRSKLKHKKAFFTIISVVGICLFVLMFFFPVHITYPTIDEAVQHEHLGNVLGMATGKDSVLVYSEFGNSNMSSLFLKQEDGYSLRPSALKESYVTFFESPDESFGRFLITIYRIKNTDDYYVTIVNNDIKLSSVENGELVITDSLNNHIESYLMNKQSSIVYYAYVEKISKEYKLYFNGIPVDFNEADGVYIAG